MTDYEKQILAHGVIEVDDWLSRTIGSEFDGEIQRLIDLFRDDYEAKKDGPDYKNAYERHLETAQI